MIGTEGSRQEIKGQQLEHTSSQLCSGLNNCKPWRILHLAYKPHTSEWRGSALQGFICKEEAQSLAQESVCGVVPLSVAVNPASRAEANAGIEVVNSLMYVPLSVGIVLPLRTTMMLVMRWKKHTAKNGSQDAVNKNHDMEAEVDGPTASVLKVQLAKTLSY